MTETWLLNDVLNSASLTLFDINFVSNNVSYTSIARDYNPSEDFDDLIYSAGNTSSDNYTAYSNGTWKNQADRTITFSIPPTGDLLTWLQANGNKFVTIEPGTYIFKDIPDTVSVQFNQGIDINFKVKGSTYSWNKILVDANSRYGVCYFTSENPGWNVGYVDIHQTAQSNYVWGCYDSSVEDMDGDADADTKTITIETAQNVPENFATWFNANTTKQVPRKSYDLSTSAKWATLSSGNHNVQIVAKASGYRDSEPSAAVTVNKTIISAGTYKFNDTITAPASGSATAFIKFKVNNTSYNSIGVTSLVSVMYTETLGAGITVYNNTDKWAAVDTANQIITITADKEVPYKFYEWFTANASAYTPTYNDCITFTGENSEFTLSIGANGAKEWDGTVWYSTDHNTWTVWDGTAISSVNKKLYLRGKNTKFYISKGVCLSLSAKAGCSGNIQTLLDYETPPTSISVEDCFRALFYGCDNLISPPELPATVLTTRCYRTMFAGCINLTSAPLLPATMLADSCYAGMFRDCVKLSSAPELPAINLEYSCYSNMFKNCTSLSSAPVLPATALREYCYADMFLSCTSLIIAPELPATQLREHCYYQMFTNCSSLKVSNSSGTKIFTCPSTIPRSAVTDMFKNTGSSPKNTPIAGETYYWYE